MEEICMSNYNEFYAHKMVYLGLNDNNETAFCQFCGFKKCYKTFEEMNNELKVYFIKH